MNCILCDGNGCSSNEPLGCTNCNGTGYDREDEDMTPKQYADAIARLGLSQRAAGAFLGVDERQSRRWVAGDSAVPESVAKLLRLMIRLKLKPEEV